MHILFYPCKVSRSTPVCIKDSFFLIDKVFRIVVGMYLCIRIICSGKASFALALCMLCWIGSAIDMFVNSVIRKQTSLSVPLLHVLRFIME